MKKTELKQLIQVILKEVEQYSADDLRDMEPHKRPGHLEKSLDKADYLGKDTEDGADSHEERQAYKQSTGQQFVREDGPDEEDGVDKAERKAEYSQWAKDRSAKEDERDMEPHKSPSYAERMADKADMKRSQDRDEGGEEDMMLGLKHDTGSGLDETKGLSGMKKASVKLDNTQMGYKDKSVTSTTEPKEKTDGKKLPVVKKPATPQIVKETLLALVKEAVEEYRTKGALGAGNAARTAPVKATGLNYKKKGVAGMGRAVAGLKMDTSIAATKRTEEAVEDFIKYNPDAKPVDILNMLVDANTEETPYNLTPKAIKTAMDKARASSPEDKEEVPPTTFSDKGSVDDLGDLEDLEGY